MNLHNFLQDFLLELGESLGFDCKKESMVGNYSIDVVWRINMCPVVAFEVELFNSQNQINRNIFKLRLCGAEKKFMIYVNDEKIKIEKII